jgi:hypothetical protein
MITIGGSETRRGAGTDDAFEAGSVVTGADITAGLSCTVATGASISAGGGWGTSRGVRTGIRALTPRLATGGGVNAERLMGAGAPADPAGFAAAGVFVAGTPGFGVLVLFSAMTDSSTKPKTTRESSC